MDFYFPDGSRLYYSNTFASAKDISGISNAAPDALATAAAHGYSDNDEVLYEGEWEDADGMVFRADQQSTDTFKLLGLDSSDTDFYPAGGAGTAKKISSWVQIPRLKNDISTDGGDPRFAEIPLLARRNSIRVPTGFNPSNFNVSMYDDPANAVQAAMLPISRKLSPVAFKMVISGGSTSYGYGYMAVSEMARMQSGDANNRAVSLALVSRWQTYTAA